MASKPSKASTVTVTTTTTTKTKGKTVTTKKKVTKPAPVSSKSKASTSKKSSTPAKFARAPLGGSWICGPNEDRPLCAPVAIANSLLAVTGIEATSGDLERLYRAAGGSGDSGVPLECVLDAAKRTGLAGCRLERWARVSGDDGQTAGLVLLLTLGDVPDLHATAATGDGRAVFWGEPFAINDLRGRAEDAYSLEWR